MAMNNLIYLGAGGGGGLSCSYELMRKQGR